MKDYQKYEENAKYKAWLCGIIDSNMESNMEEIQRYKQELADMSKEDREGHWKWDAIETREYQIQCAKEAMNKILYGGKNK